MKLKQMTNRNGEIELLRFICCIVIILRHSQYVIGDDYPFLGGALGVEFFFLVSGYLMAKSLEKMKPYVRGGELGKETLAFIRKKVSVLMPDYLLAWMIGFTFVHGVKKSGLFEIVNSFLRAGWELCFLKMTSLNGGGIDGPVWYISSMLLCMMILYPLMRRYKDAMLHIVLPLSVGLILGWLFQNGTLRNPTKWYGFVYKGNVRAFAELGMGMLLYYITAKLAELRLTPLARWLLTLFKWVGFGLYFYYMWWIESSRWDYGFLFLLAACIGIAFSRQAVDTHWYSSKLTIWLGQFSLPLYLCHDYYAVNLKYLLPEDIDKNRCLAIYILVSAFTALTVMMLSGLLKKHKNEMFRAARKLLLRE